MKLEQISANMGIKSIVTYKWTCPPKREHFHTKSQQMMGEKVDGTIEERNLAEFMVNKACTGPGDPYLTIWEKRVN